MYTGIYKIADVAVQIQSIYNGIHNYCQEYRWDGPAEITVTTCPEDICYEQEKSDKENLLEGKPTIRYAEPYLETLAVYRKIADQLLSRDIFLFHGSAIAVDGRAVLFTAKSGTGKSTHTKLWREAFGDRAVMINDDKPLLKVADEGVLVCGTPWDGKHRISTNCIMPLEAICILERGESNEIRAISAREALPMLMQQSHRSTDPAAVSRMLQVINKLSTRVRFYLLRCNMEPEAAQIAYREMLG